VRGAAATMRRGAASNELSPAPNSTSAAEVLIGAGAIAAGAAGTGGAGATDVVVAGAGGGLETNISAFAGSVFAASDFAGSGLADSAFAEFVFAESVFAVSAVSVCTGGEAAIGSSDVSCMPLSIIASRSTTCSTAP
jgi:hypothetical protein